MTAVFASASPLTIPFRHRFPVLLADPRALQQVDDVVVVLVTRVLVHLLVGIDPRPRNHRGPRPRPRVWILDRELVADGPRVDAREPLGDAKGRWIRVLENHAFVGPEIRRFDDQRVAIPAAARVAEPLAQRAADVRPAVEWNDPRAVNHLGCDRDIPRALENL